MLPSGRIELDHHRLRRVGGIDENLEGKFCLDGHLDRWIAAFIIILRHPLAADPQRAVPAGHRPCLLRHPVGLAHGGYPGGKIILHQHPLLNFGWRQGHQRCRIHIDDLLHFGQFPLLCGSNLGIVICEPLGFIRSDHFQDRGGENGIAIHGRIRRAVEEGVELIELLLGKRIELVIVTLGAACGKPEPSLRGRRGAFHGVTENEFGINRPTLSGGDIAAVESRGHNLILGGIGQQIASQLFDGKLVKGQVAIKSPHHPIAIQPHRSFIVQMQSMRVTIPRHIQPVAAHLFTISR